MTKGRITFLDNPWPLGHRLETISMTLAGSETGVRLHLDLETVAFDAEGPGRQATGADGWGDPDQWTVHPNAVISSTRWNSRGLPVAGPDEMTVDWTQLAGTWRSDDDALALDSAVEERSFGAEVLGTAAVGGVELTLTATGTNEFDLTMTGALARTWIGETNFAHRFEVTASGVRLT